MDAHQLVVAEVELLENAELGEGELLELGEEVVTDVDLVEVGVLEDAGPGRKTFLNTSFEQNVFREILKNVFTHLIEGILFLLRSKLIKLSSPIKVESLRASIIFSDNSKT